MSKYKLTYFDFDGGRGEPIRIAMHAAGVTFEDHRVSFAEFGEISQGLRFKSVPLMEIDDAIVTQSNGLSRYFGKMAGLYPKDGLQALYCDEVLGALEDVNHYLVRTFNLEGEELKLAREELADGWLSVYLSGLDELLTRGGGEYFVNNELSIADLKSFVMARNFLSGNLDYIPADLMQKKAPGLVQHHARIAAHPVVIAYYASRV